MMSRLVARGALLLGVLAAGVPACASKRSGPPQTAPTSASASAPDESARLGSVRTRIDADSGLVIYLDARGFRDSPFFSAIETLLAILPGADDARAALAGQCNFDPIQSLQEAAVSVRWKESGFDDESVLGVLQFSEPPERTLACIAHLEPNASVTQIEGRAAREWPEGAALVADGGLLFVGLRSRVMGALSQPPGPELSLEEKTYLHARAQGLSPDGKGRSRFSVGPLPPSGTLLSFVDEASSPEGAAHKQVVLEQIRERAKQHLAQTAQTPDGRRYSSQLLDSVVIVNSGVTTIATLELKDDEAEAAFTGMLAGLAMYSMRSYLAQAKTAEARLMLPRIAQGLATHAASKGTPRFPPSAPRTPTDVPSGAKFTSDAATWSHPSWKAIGFQIEDPQFYSYEYETAPDGVRATIVAHGDLDGDGARSRFELTVEIEPSGEIVIAPDIVEIDPLE